MTVRIGGVTSSTVEAKASFTRPANTTAYTAKDVVSNSASETTLMTFPLARRLGGGGTIYKARVMTDQKTNVATYRLWLYTTAAPPTAVAVDNGPMLLLWANRLVRIGFLDIGPLATEDATSSTAASALNLIDRLPFVCASSDSNIYGVLETLTAFTPASAQNFFVELVADVS